MTRINKIIIGVTIIIASLFFIFSGSKYNTFYGDALGYYVYLPSTFIYHDVKRPDSIPPDIDIHYPLYKSITSYRDQKNKFGYVLNQYTYGVAFMELPFFCLAHAYEKIKGGPANGYSDSYQVLIKISSLVYGLLGLLLIYRILKRYFIQSLSILATVIIFLCTNLFWFTIYQAGMSHMPLFFLYALLILLTIQAHEKPGLGRFVSIGFIAGLITIIRPSDIVCILIPALYDVYDKETLQKKLLFIRNNIKYLPGIAIAFIIPMIPQLMYWKAVTGHHLCYSYGDQSFNWQHPKIIEGLFYSSNGWLPYAPVMIFALAGLLLFKQIRPWACCLWLILPIYIYIIYSWYCYNYINGLGSRPMIHMYPLLAIPLTAFIQLISRQKHFIKILFTACCLFFMALNFSYGYQREKWLISTENSTMFFNWHMLFRTHLTYNDLVIKDVGEIQPDTGSLQYICTLAIDNYEDSLSAHYERDTANGSQYIYHMTPWEEYHGLPKITYSKSLFRDAKWLKCSGLFMYHKYPDNESFKRMIIITTGNKWYKSCEIENKIDGYNKSAMPALTYNHHQENKWGYVYFFVKIPKDIRDADQVRMFIWNYAKLDLYIDNLRLDLYK